MAALAGQFITPADYNAEVENLQDQVDDINAELATGLPRGIIGYAEQTSDELTANATEGLVFGVAFNVAANRQILVMCKIRIQGDAGDNLVIRVRLDDDTSGDQVDGGSFTFETNGGGAVMPLLRNLGGVLELSEGAHTLFVTQDLTAGSGIAGIKGSPEAASSIVVMDMGPG